MDRKKLNSFAHTNASQITAAIALVILMILLSFMSDNFFSPTNLINICLQASIVGALAICETFVIISGGIDLSVGAIVALSSSIMGTLVVNSGMNSAVGIIVCLVISVLCGFFNGFFISILNMPPFVVTLGTMTAFRGLAYQLTNAKSIYGLPSGLNFLGQAYIGIIPIAVIVVFILYAISWFVLKRTKLGLDIYALGGNVGAAKLSGIRVNKVKCVIYTISGLLCGIAGIIVAGRMNGTSALVANGYETDAIAAAAIGGISMAGGKGNIWGTLIGVLLLQCIRNGMNMLGVSSYLQMVVIGLVIILAVGMDCFRQLRKK